MTVTAFAPPAGGLIPPVNLWRSKVLLAGVSYLDTTFLPDTIDIYSYIEHSRLLLTVECGLMTAICSMLQ